MKRYETVTYAAVECKEGTFVRHSDHEAALAEAVKKEREAVIADFEAAHAERMKRHDEWAKEAAHWKAEGDMFGWNFFSGMASGGIWIDICFQRLLRNLRARSDK